MDTEVSDTTVARTLGQMRRKLSLATVEWTTVNHCTSNELLSNAIHWTTFKTLFVTQENNTYTVLSFVERGHKDGETNAALWTQAG